MMEPNRKPCSRNLQVKTKDNRKSILRLTRSTDGIRLIQKISRRLEICNKLRRPFMLRVVKRRTQNGACLKNNKKDKVNPSTCSIQVDKEKHPYKVSEKDVSNNKDQAKNEFIYVQSDEENDLYTKSFHNSLQSNKCCTKKPYIAQIDEEQKRNVLKQIICNNENIESKKDIIYIQIDDEQQKNVLKQSICNNEIIESKKDIICIQSDEDDDEENKHLGLNLSKTNNYKLKEPHCLQNDKVNLKINLLNTPTQTSNCVVKKPFSVQDSEQTKQKNPFLISDALFTKKKRTRKNVAVALVSQNKQITKNDNSLLISNALFDKEKKKYLKKRVKKITDKNLFPSESQGGEQKSKKKSLRLSNDLFLKKNEGNKIYKNEKLFFIKKDTDRLNEETSVEVSNSNLSHLHRVSSIFKARERGELDVEKIKPKTGPWSKAEVLQLETNMARFLKSYNMTSSKSLVFPSTKEELEFRRKTNFNLKMCHGIQRYGQSIMRKIVIHFVGALKEGYPTGKDAQMFWKMVKIYGTNWKLIGSLLKRTPQSLYHFYIHEKNKKNKNFQTKSWFNAETEMLIKLVDESFKRGDKIRWNKISEQIVSRSPMQCRQKWWWIKKQILDKSSSLCSNENEVIRQLISQAKF
ncbi:uncharacterized protein LOC136090268 isoform X2 [Hydra vulgaris]|uniref:Uncharacterized protein LOC136090268 isoform X2 n=1 Tax=Hydra vulgaris TaxID=6087 RepID=A0ABM4DDX6_HYDVU